MQLPFTASEFFRVFGDYNEAVWPAQPLFLAMALVAVALVFSRSPWSDMWISTLLAVFWLWMAFAYHLSFFAGINPLAYVFAALSAGGAAAFLWHGPYRKHLRFRWQGSRWNVAGASMIIFSLAVYPLWMLQTGHAWPDMPTFGLPCPTTLFTVGILGFLVAPYPRSALLAPLLWCAIGVQAAFLLEVTPDLSLLAGAALVAGLMAAAGRGAKQD